MPAQVHLLQVPNKLKPGSFPISPVVISVPLEGGRRDGHGFATQDGRLAQMGRHVLHVRDHGRVWQGKPGGGKERTKQKEGIRQLAQICNQREVESGQPAEAHEVERPPPERTK